MRNAFGTLEVNYEEATSIASILTSEVCLKILKMLKKEELDISTLSARLGYSEAHISEEVRRLEEAKMIDVNYVKGKRGIRKVCLSRLNSIIINID